MSPAHDKGVSVANERLYAVVGPADGELAKGCPTATNEAVAEVEFSAYIYRT